MRLLGYFPVQSPVSGQHLVFKVSAFRGVGFRAFRGLGFRVMFVCVEQRTPASKVHRNQRNNNSNNPIPTGPSNKARSPGES